MFKYITYNITIQGQGRTHNGPPIIKRDFVLDGENVEIVNDFIYLGLNIERFKYITSSRNRLDGPNCELKKGVHNIHANVSYFSINLCDTCFSCISHTGCFI